MKEDRRSKCLKLRSENLKQGPRTQMRQQPPHVAKTDGNAPFCRRVAGSGNVKEDRGATSALATPEIPVENEADIVELVGTLELFMARAERRSHGPIIVRVAHRVTPEHVGSRSAHGKRRWRHRSSIAAPITKQERHDGDRSCAIALALAACPATAPQSGAKGQRARLKDSLALIAGPRPNQKPIDCLSSLFHRSPPLGHDFLPSS